MIIILLSKFIKHDLSQFQHRRKISLFGFIDNGFVLICNFFISQGTLHFALLFNAGPFYIDISF